MTGIRSSTVALGASLMALASGCQQPKMDMAEMMKPPPRPAELDRLEPFVGKWTGTAEMKMMGSDKPMKSTGASTFAWECDKRALVEHFEGTMGEDAKMTGLNVWTWDASAKKYRNDMFDCFGNAMTFNATYDEASKTWHAKGKHRCPMTGEMLNSEGTMKLIDNNTMEWRWTEWNSWKTKKYMEMSGTSRRE